MSSRIASLEVQIGANVSGFQSASAQVKAGLAGIANEAKGAGGKIDQFNAKARALEESYATGAISAAQYARQGKALAWSMMGVGEKFSVVRGYVNSAGMALMKFGAAATGVGLATKGVYEFAKAGAQIEYTREKFDRLARSADSTGRVFLNELRIATKGTVDDFGLLRQGSDLLQLGLAKDTQEAVRLSRVMTALGMDTGELTLALANQSKRRLDQLGLSLTRFNEIEARLKDSGLSKDQAFKEAFLQTAEETVAITGNQADSNLGNFMRFQSQLSNAWNAYKEAMPTTSMGWMFGNQTVSDVAGQLAGTLGMLRKIASPDYGLGAGAWNPQTNRFEFDVNRTPQYYQQAQSVQYQNPYGVPGGMLYAGGRGREQIRTADDYSQAAAYYSRLQGEGAMPGAVGVAEAIPDYKNLLSVGLNLTQFTEDYHDKTVALNDKLREQQEVLRELEKAHKTRGEEYLDQIKKITETEQAIDDLGKNYTDTYNTMALSAIKNRDATEQQQLDFARAAGLITEDAYQQASAIDRISEAFTNNEMSAGAAAAGVNGVMAMLKMYDGLSVAAYIDVYVRQHGGLGAIAAPASVGGSGTQGSLIYTGQGQAAAWLAAQNRWTGGKLGDGAYIVGDAPGGVMTPYSELIIGDQVVDAKTTMWLYRMGLLKNTKGLREGTEGYQGSYFRGMRAATGHAIRRPRRSSTMVRVGGAGVQEGDTASGDVATMTETTATDPMAAAFQVNAQAQNHTAQNFHNYASQQAQVMTQNNQELVAELREVQRILKKMPDRDFSLLTAKYATQTSI